jgi:pimeloyl-ACP methyl ester carboxylesterase
VPVLIWNAWHDTYSPHENGRWLADNIPTAQEVRLPKTCHFSAGFEAVPAVLGWCATGEYPPSIPAQVG